MFSSIRKLGTLCIVLALGGCPKTEPVTVAPSPEPTPAPEQEPEQPEAQNYPEPPPPGDPKPVNFPTVGNFKLPNGLAVYVVENHEVPFVEAQLGLKYGAFTDPADKPGTAYLTLPMLGRGTKAHDYEALTDELDAHAI